MKYAMFYSSATGNTQLLAETLESELAGESKVDNPEEADTVERCVDQGAADEQSRKFLKSLKNRKVFLFGTAGASATARRISTAFWKRQRTT